MAYMRHQKQEDILHIVSADTPLFIQVSDVRNFLMFSTFLDSAFGWPLSFEKDIAPMIYQDFSFALLPEKDFKPVLFVKPFSYASLASILPSEYALYPMKKNIFALSRAGIFSEKYSSPQFTLFDNVHKQFLYRAPLKMHVRLEEEVSKFFSKDLLTMAGFGDIKTLDIRFQKKDGVWTFQAYPSNKIYFPSGLSAVSLKRIYEEREDDDIYFHGLRATFLFHHPFFNYFIINTRAKDFAKKEILPALNFIDLSLYREKDTDEWDYNMGFYFHSYSQQDMKQKIKKFFSYIFPLKQEKILYDNTRVSEEILSLDAVKEEKINNLHSLFLFPFSSSTPLSFSSSRHSIILSHAASSQVRKEPEVQKGVMYQARSRCEISSDKPYIFLGKGFWEIFSSSQNFHSLSNIFSSQSLPSAVYLQFLENYFYGCVVVDKM